VIVPVRLEKFHEAHDPMRRLHESKKNYKNCTSIAKRQNSNNSPCGQYTFNQTRYLTLLSYNVSMSVINLLAGDLLFIFSCGISRIKIV